MSSSVASKWLAPLSAIYGAGARARNKLYQSGVFKTFHVSAPVISVGNITTGGTGKTPMVAYLAREISKRNFQPCILTRGYGRENENERVVMRDGAKILTDARTGGDEPFLLAEILDDTNAIIISDARRVEAARWALREFAEEAEKPNRAIVFILDDGFQHQRLARDLDLVLLDATDPFGGGKLLPSGRLREPLDGLKRADAIVISRAAQAADLRALQGEIRALTSNKTPIFISSFLIRRLRPLNDLSAQLEGQDDAREANNDNLREARSDNLREARGSNLGGTCGTETASHQTTPRDLPFAAFCALGNPQAFFAHLQRAGFKLADTRAFRDHHRYTQLDADATARQAIERGARALLTTAKDAVKLRDLNFPLPLYAVDVELAIDGEQKFCEMLMNAIKRKNDK